MLVNWLLFNEVNYVIKQDFGEFGIAPKVIATKENFASNEQERKRKAEISSSLAGQSVIAGAESVLVDLVQPRKYVYSFYVYAQNKNHFLHRLKLC